MVKKEKIREAIKKIIKEMIDANNYASATLTTQGPGRSRFTKTGRPPGVMDEEGMSSGLETRQLADSFTFDELEQLLRDKKITKADYNGAKNYLQAWIDQHPTYEPGKGNYRDKYINKTKI